MLPPVWIAYLLIAFISLLASPVLYWTGRVLLECFREHRPQLRQFINECLEKSYPTG